MPLKTNCFYDFENFRLDLTEKVLLREGKAVPLTPKVFRTLQVFVERAGCLIEKDELMREIWQDRFVDESNLTYNVKMLRKALGDDAASPSFIETVPRRGYRFIAEIKEVSAVKNLPPENLKTYAPPRQSYLPTAAVGILLFCTIAFGSWLARDTIFAENSNTAILKNQFRSEKFSSSGKVQFAAISPDGKLAAYTDETNGKFSLWLKHLETSDSSQIVAAADESFAGLAFAHDGQSIFFVRRLVNEGERAAIYRVMIFGGIPEKILENVEGWISVSPDDNQISFVRCQQREDDYCSLFVADANGGHERRLLTRPRPIRISDNQFSPDGKRLAFAAGESWNGASGFQLWQIDLTSGAEIPLSPKTFFSVKNVEWLPNKDGLLIAALEKLDGQAKIWHIAADGTALPLTRDAANYRTISLNRDASRMIATRLDNDFRLYLSTDGATKVLTAAREAVFTPDGKIVYATNDGDIWTIRRDGGEQRQLTNHPDKDFSPIISPDNKFIYFTSNRTGANQIWRMNAGGGDETQITQTEGGYGCAASADGKWIYYLSGLRETLWKVSADGGDETQISERKMISPAVSPDGGKAAYFFRDNTADNQIKLAMLSIEDKKILKTITFPAEKSAPGKIAWSKDNQTLYCIVKSESKNLLWRQSLSDEKPILIADLGDEQITDFALAADEKDYLFVRGKWIHDAVLIAGLK